ncbi:MULTISPECIES: DUF2225 domain-containing protein [Clostridium]|jgi:uncharacterized protein (DUF2225 family)|uniref:DUF2225 domain-containing protein n=1 Tax=Clostridium saccharoperbutylacetonicum N1-4(HMT) TaxID=931276 RepID=M1N6P4_9CLOT|nr:MULTISPECIES: DUF2225 domain-containing protein [Clostridium]AGF59072.1 hypothetical protein Cspa_c53270 [Clostridium saccharoperbutylacetonicum N1-4(HMT)]AQR97741.1 hypothetical protein CLSAP_50740 [Clostridium saccharoperbutylacetonicum]NRT60140.1 hypothetical protein [Clostridium saccharoperbutylacetonicum]NSB23452.1 hypothetical protein [Clostridium saccharoperbutylacetonicum]NSB33629.1 hypothetical protein [Clostridium saccharoperbutylacetonicum]
MNDTNILNHLFDKNIICPVCDAHFKAKTVKSKSPRISSRDSDFFIRYSPVVNPYFYDVLICNSCGYAAMRSDFDNIKTHKKELVFSNVTPKWKPRVYPDILDEKLAIERYKLALLNAVLLDLQDSTKAMLSLKIAWMYRLLNDSNQEKTFLTQALDGFNDAYSKELFPIYGLQRDAFMYMLGELNRKLGNTQNALLWYSKTIVSVNSSNRIKELARIGKDLIKNENI